jgi:pimeloyl-ACP methyl ester carboxylesterase
MQACQLPRDGYIEDTYGDEEAIRPLVNGAKLAELAGRELVTLGGSGHVPHVRDPVRVNLLLRDFTRRRHR